MSATGPSWDFRRGPAAARILVELGADHGLSPVACLAGTGLSPRDLDDPDTVVEAGQELAIARHLIAHLGDRPGLGVQAGQRYTIGSLGVWGFALLTSPTVRDLLRLGTHYAALSFAFIRPRYEEHDRDALVILDDAEIPADARAFFVERELAKLATLLPVVLGALGRHGRLEAALDGARGAALKAAFPAVDIRTGCAQHVVAYPRARLDAPLPQADPSAARDLEAQCHALLDRRRRLSGTAARVRARLLAHPHQLADMHTVAAELHIDERTLRRHLADEGTTFRALADEIRQTLAIELLTTARLTVDEVAHRLGYHDAAGFTRAFKRWTGTTPGSLTRRIAEPPPDRAGRGSRASPSPGHHGAPRSRSGC
jgi:AraC-like DNA-binding protein